MDTRVAILVAGAVILNLSQPAAQQREAAPPQSFDVASVRPNTAGQRAIRVDTLPGGQFVATNVPVRSLVRLAYGLEDAQVAGAPAWMNDDRFDVLARATVDLPPLAGPFSGSPIVRDMVKALLAQRFALVAHMETREMPMFALVRAREDQKPGGRLTPSGVDCAALTAKQGPDDGPPPCGFRMAPGMVVLEGTPLSNLASALTALTGRIVVDRTGLTGNYDLQLHWEGSQPGPSAAVPSGPSLFTALQEQAGLKLEAIRGPADVLVIDRVSRPTPD